MTMRTTARLFGIALLLSIGLMTGCASTEETSDQVTAEQAIADAKAANAEAAALGHEWRDTGKLIKEAEDKLAAGDEDGAIALANKAKYQAEQAVKQANVENQKFLNNNAEASSASASSKGAMGAGGVTSYSVVKGDSLWKISGKDEVYANPYQWPLIYKTNRDKIKDADLIYPGQVFDIDQNASASEIDAAINHAKTRGAWSIGDTEQSDIDYLNK
jgi:nucleoid-associated protein YgaU